MHDPSLHFFGIVFSLLSHTAAAAQEAPSIGPAPAWVAPAPALAEPDAGWEFGPAQTLLIDRQDRYSPAGDQSYVEVATHVRSPDGLGAAGLISIPWHPNYSDLTVHRVEIIRGVSIIDILAEGQTFEVLRREQQLEFAVLDGVLTATMQPAGLEVGDTLRIAYTYTTHNPVLAGHSEMFIDARSFPVSKFRLRQIWEPGKKLAWRAAPSLPKPKVKNTKSGSELVLELADVKPPAPLFNAPSRFLFTGQFEASDFRSWSEISALMHPLYRDASALKADSPLKAEASKIREASGGEPKAMAEKALRLVQDKVRYVFLGVGAAGYTPATADDTWSRRYGDCKGKTTMLLALLGELGIAAEPVFVSTVFGDSLKEHLPVLALFDHALVRAVIGGKEYWLDGTKLGDRDLNAIPAPRFGFALPLRAGGADLTAIRTEPLQKPNSVVYLSIDGREGLIGKLPAQLKLSFSGDSAAFVRATMNATQPTQRQAVLDAATALAAPGAEVKGARYEVDEETGLVHVVGSGRVKLADSDGDLDEPDPRPAKYYFPPSLLGVDLIQYKKEAESGRKAPFLLDAPSFTEYRIEVLTPSFVGPLKAGVDDVDASEAGVFFARRIDVKKDSVLFTATMKATVAEISVPDAVKVANIFEKAAKEAPYFYLVRPPSKQTENENPGAPQTAADDLIEKSFRLAEEGKTTEALAAVDEALERDPGVYNGLGQRAMLLVVLNHEDAAGAVDAALAADSRDWLSLAAAGYISARKDEHQDAVKEFTRSIEINPNHSFARRERSLSYWRLEDRKRAFEDIEFVVERFPNEAYPRAIQADMLEADGREAEARETVEAGLKLSPNNSDLLVSRSRLKSAKKDFVGALTDLRNAVASAQQNVWIVHNAICWTSGTRQFEIEESRDDCEKAVELSDNAASALDSRALFRMRLGDLDGALADYDAALAKEPTQAASLYGRGLTKLRRGDPTGEDDIKAAIEIAPAVEKQFAEYGLTQ